MDFSILSQPPLLISVDKRKLSQIKKTVAVEKEEEEVGSSEPTVIIIK